MVDLLQLCELPGVKGAVRITSDGEIQDCSIDASPDIVAAITTHLSAAARRIGAVLNFKDFEHALLSYRDGGNPLLIFPHESAFIGLVIDVPQTLVGISNSSQTYFSKELIAASHILTRIRAITGRE